MKKYFVILFMLLTCAVNAQVVNTSVWFNAAEKTYETVLNDGNTVGWYIASETDDITKDATDSVSVWADHLGSGHDFTATGAEQPIWGEDSITFNGTTNTMSVSFEWDYPGMIYVVLQQESWTYGRYILTDNGSGATIISQRNSSPEIRIDAASAVANSSGISIGDYGIVRAKFQETPDSCYLQINEDNRVAIIGPQSYYTMGGLILSATDLPSNISFKEIICRDKIDTESDEALIYAYLKNKYGL